MLSVVGFVNFHLQFGVDGGGLVYLVLVLFCLCLNVGRVFGI
jgi:hypothetical protein